MVQALERASKEQKAVLMENYAVDEEEKVCWDVLDFVGISCVSFRFPFVLFHVIIMGGCRLHGWRSFCRASHVIVGGGPRALLSASLISSVVMLG